MAIPGGGPPTVDADCAVATPVDDRSLSGKIRESNGDCCEFIVGSNVGLVKGNSRGMLEFVRAEEPELFV